MSQPSDQPIQVVKQHSMSVTILPFIFDLFALDGLKVRQKFKITIF